MKLSKKLTLTTTLISLLAIVSFTLVTYRITYNSIMKSNERELRMVSLKPGNIMGTRGIRQYFLALDDKILWNPFDFDYIPTEGITTVDENNFLFVKIKSNLGIVTIGKDVTASFRTVRNIRTYYFIIAALTIFCIFIVTFIVTAKSTKKLSHLTEQIDTIDIDKIDKRLDEVKTNDEIEDLAKKFNIMLSRIERAYRSQEMFVANISHELRTPVTTIIGYTKLLKRWGKNDEKILNESLENIYQTSISMENLINNMLLLSSNENVPKEEFNIKNLMEEIVSDEKGPASAKITLYSKMDQMNITSNRELFKTMVKIIINNATKYATSYIKIYNENNCLFIENDGPSISSDDVDKLFERFYKTKESTGFGLGLSIAKSISEKLNLNLYYDRNFKSATRFCIKL